MVITRQQACSILYHFSQYLLALPAKQRKISINFTSLDVLMNLLRFAPWIKTQRETIIGLFVLIFAFFPSLFGSVLSSATALIQAPRESFQAKPLWAAEIDTLSGVFSFLWPQVSRLSGVALVFNFPINYN
jgi:hypothetical protein